MTLCLGYKIAHFDSEADNYITQGLIVVICLFAYRLIYGLTIGPVTFLYIPEIIEPNMMPVIMMLYCLLMAFLMMFYPLVKHYLFNDNAGPAFIFFGVYSLVSIIISSYLLV
jgi:hypothetical protein